MKAITIRIDEELFKKIEAKRGARSKSEFYRSILMGYISDKSEDQSKQKYAHSSNTRNYQASFSNPGPNRIDGGSSGSETTIILYLAAYHRSP